MKKAILIPAPHRGPPPRIRTPKQRAPQFQVQPRKVAAVQPTKQPKAQYSGGVKKQPLPPRREPKQQWKLQLLTLPPIEFYRPPLHTLRPEDPRRHRAILPGLQEQTNAASPSEKATQTDETFYYGPPSPEPGPAIPEGYFGPLRVTLTAPHITYAERGPDRR